MGEGKWKINHKFNRHQLTSSLLDLRQQIRPGRCAIHNVTVACRIRHNELLLRGESAHQVLFKVGKMINDQLEIASRCSLKLMRCDGCYRRTLAVLVVHPIERIISIILTVGAERALVLHRAPSAVGIARQQTFAAGPVHVAFMNAHLWHLLIAHDINVHLFLVEEHVLVDCASFVDQYVGILRRERSTLNHQLLDATLWCADEDNCEAAGGCRCYRSYFRAESCRRCNRNRHFTAERWVHIQSAKVFAQRLQARRHTSHVRRNEVEAARTVAVEARLDVLHELSSNRFQRINAERRSVGGDVGIRLRKGGEQNVIAHLNV